MADTDSGTTFTASVEAYHADDLRAVRDRTDADIQGEFPNRDLTDVDIRFERAQVANIRLRSVREAIDRAVARVTAEAVESLRFEYEDAWGNPTSTPAVDLEGATITVTVTDLVATATLTMPGSPRALSTEPAPYAPRHRADCTSCFDTGLVDWYPGQQRNTEDEQQPCPDCVATRPAARPVTAR